MMAVIWPVCEVAQADAHIVGDRTREGDGDADSEDSVGDSEWVEVAVIEEKRARSQP